MKYRWLLAPEHAQTGPVVVLDNDLLLSKVSKLVYLLT